MSEPRADLIECIDYAFVTVSGHGHPRERALELAQRELDAWDSYIGDAPVVFETWLYRWPTPHDSEVGFRVRRAEPHARGAGRYTLVFPTGSEDVIEGWCPERSSR